MFTLLGTKQSGSYYGSYDERTGSRFDSGLLKLWMVRGPSQLCAKVWFRQVLSSTCNWIEMEVHSGQQLLPAQETNEIIPCGSQK